GTHAEDRPHGGGGDLIDDTMIIDSHCHLHDPAFADLKETLRLSMAHDVWGAIAVGCDPETNAQTLEAAAAAPKAVWPCLGFHPDRTELTDEDLERVEAPPALASRDRDRDLVTGVPLDALLVESDGPWEYGGEFEGIDSGPWLASRVAEEVAKLKHLPVEDVMFQLSINTCRLFDLMWA